MRRYVLVFAALLVLTGLTFGLSFAELGPWGTPVALTIGAAKSLIVALWFMHLVEHRDSSRIAFAVAVGLALCLVTFTVLDVVTRSTEGEGAPLPAPTGAAPAAVTLPPASPPQIN